MDKRLPVIKRIIPKPIEAAIKGMEIFISFITPENEVKVEQPVKFMA